MNFSNKMKKYLLGLVVGTTGLAVVSLAVSNLNISLMDGLINAKGADSYSITLNSGNKVTSSGTYTKYTARGSAVEYTYTNVGTYSSGHTTLVNGGTIVNKSIIHSITGFTAEFEGSLQARVAYTTTKWGSYFDLTSNQPISLGSNPYYLELKATTNVVLKSARYDFSCAVNPEAEEKDTSGTYDLTFTQHGSSYTEPSTSMSTLSNLQEEMSGSAYDYVSAATISRAYPGKQGTKIGSGSNSGYIDLDFSSSFNQTITSIDFTTVKYGNDNSQVTIYVNDSSSSSGSFLAGASSSTITVNEVITALKISTTKRAYLQGITFNYGSTVTPDVPAADEVGFSATDANKQNYTTNSIFDNDNALSVYALFSDGSRNSLTKGGDNGYAYSITDPSGNTIDTSAKFSVEGEYTLTVTYKDYIPVVSTFIVGKYVYPVDVAAAMSKVTFTTADVLSEYLASNLTATVEYSDGTTSTSIPYADFASRGLGVKLITKYGIAYDMTKPFGSDGTWTLKVYDIANEEMYFNISLTVTAIPVETIGLSETSKTMYPNDTLQLMATVNPSTATKLAVAWASDNESVATVDENGLVTAVAVGNVNITATSTDGTDIVATCAITVVAAPEIEEVAADINPGSNASVCEISGLDGVKVGTGSKTGNLTIDVGSGATKLTFYAAGWNNSSTTLTLTGATANPSSISLTSDSGISGNSPYTLSGDPETYFIEVTLSNVTSDTTITVSGSARFILWDAKYYVEGSSTPATPIYPTAIAISGTNSITIGETSQLSVTYTPSDTNVKNVTWSSSNTSVATVSSAGLVTGVAQGSATITATAEAANSGTITKTYTITVNPVAVTSVSLSDASATVKAGKTITLLATVNPSNATNKNINWSSSDTSIATVTSAGVVTGVAQGNATITATSAADSSKKATCIVTVTAAAGGEETFDITYTDLPSAYATTDTVYTAASGIKFQAYNCAGGYSSKMQFKASSGYLQTTEDLELQTLTINDRESNSLTVYGSNTAGSFSTEITGENDVYDLSGYSYFKVARTASGAGYCSSLTIVTGTPTPTDPTSIIMSSSSIELGVGGTKQLSVTYVPSNANQNKDITWSSSNTNVATVSSDGLVSVKSTATAGQTATITAKLTNLPTITATCTITVVEQQKDDHTVLVYICGADLESENQLATGDIQEMLKVSNQPDDVNIVLETGGAKSWASTYGISSTNLERWHISNKSLVKDNSLTYASMGASSTLQSFIEYGLSNYPAERTGLILWNHGGGMRGVCYDEKKNDDVLKSSEVKSAVSGALSNCGMSGQKLEWIGYDACLMAVQDIAETNSAYFNYMIASEESEAGYGWDYDTWVDDLYAKKTTPNILKAIVDGFISDNGGASSSSGDQTLSYLDLSYAAAYKTAWENMAGALNSVVTTSNKSSFNSAITGNVKHYGDSDYDYFCTFDAWDFIDKLANNSAFSSFRIDSSYTTAVKNAHANLVAYSVAQKGAGVSKGLCMYWPNSTQYSDVSTYYTTSETNFTTWRNFCVNKGYHA